MSISLLPFIAIQLSCSCVGIKTCILIEVSSSILCWTTFNVMVRLLYCDL
uniref:Uncharacterized protein n=1 Tax=Rhizophora mucronata TaxID=61149 RepID=A0A2P2MYF6_RHIMU